MGLKYQLETLEGVDESVASFYIKEGDVFKLDIEGLKDPSEKLIETLDKERKISKEAIRKAKELEKAREESETERLKKEKEYEELYKREQKRQVETSTELAELKNKIAENKIDKLAMETVSSLTKDVKRAEVLKKQARDFIQKTPEGVKIVGPNGEEYDTKKLSDHLSENYPFLVDGSSAGGGGAKGGTGSPQTENNLKLTPAERINLARRKG